MKKVKIEARLKNAFNAFFEDENLHENSALIIAENNSLTQANPAGQITQLADKSFDLFKKIFAFIPGVLFLHFVVPATIEFGCGMAGLFWLVAGIFMVWAGIGDLKNKKHLLLPLSVILTALIFSLPFAVFPIGSINGYIYFYIGILPLLFIAPILTKGVIEKNERNKD